VTAGLQKIDGIVRQAAAAVATDRDQAKELAESIESEWEPIEGTIKANDQDAYITFEDSFAALEGAAEKGDAARATEVAGTVTKAVADYVARFPA
jgi:hypothetical protein